MAKASLETSIGMYEDAHHDIAIINPIKVRAAMVTPMLRA